MENAYTSQKLLEVFKKDKTYENAKNYIISFICEYTGKQGYYDYYKLNNEWESVFKMLRTNHVQLIVPARGVTPAITKLFDVNYVLGQKISGGRQQTVVTDYRSQVDTDDMEYAPLEYHQGTFDFEHML